ncbi:MAG: hypothetical protein ACP5RZ_00810 [Thermoplasmata archaeon]
MKRVESLYYINYFKIFKPDPDFLRENFQNILKDVFYLASSSDEISSMIYFDGTDYRFALFENHEPAYLYYENVVPGKFTEYVNAYKIDGLYRYGFSKNYYIPYYPKHNIFSDIYFAMEKKGAKYFIFMARKKRVYSRFIAKKFAKHINNRYWRGLVEKKINSEMYEAEIFTDLDMDIFIRDPFTGQAIVKNGKKMIMDPSEISYFLIPPVKNEERRKLLWI